MNRLELFLSLSCLPVGLAELDLHLIEVSLHLLLEAHGLIPAATLCVQGGLQGVNGPLHVPLALLRLLVLLSQLALDVGLDLVELKLGSQNLTLFMFQGSLV